MSINDAREAAPELKVRSGPWRRFTFSMKDILNPLLDLLHPQCVKFLQKLGHWIFFLKQVFQKQWLNEKVMCETFQQTFRILRGGWFFFVLSGAALGIVMTLQINYSFIEFPAHSHIPLMVALPLLREFGPVLSAWLFAGMSGSAMIAETGLMKANDQLLSLELMGAQPFGWVFFPRFMASLISLPLLMMSFVMAGLLGALGCGTYWIDLDSSIFWQAFSSEIAWRDEFRIALVKSLVFAMLTAWSSLYFGHESERHTEGVAEATTQGVTLSLTLTLISDLFIDLFFFTV